MNSKYLWKQKTFSGGRQNCSRSLLEVDVVWLITLLVVVHHDHYRYFQDILMPLATVMMIVLIMFLAVVFLATSKSVSCKIYLKYASKSPAFKRQILFAAILSMMPFFVVDIRNRRWTCLFYTYICYSDVTRKVRSIY